MIAAFASILVPLLVGRLDRCVLLAVLLAVMAAASLVSALAPAYGVLIGSRVLVGITIGGFWAIARLAAARRAGEASRRCAVCVAGSLAMRLVPGPSVPRAMVLVFGG